MTLTLKADVAMAKSCGSAPLNTTLVLLDQSSVVVEDMPVENYCQRHVYNVDAFSIQDCECEHDYSSLKEPLIQAEVEAYPVITENCVHHQWNNNTVFDVEVQAALPLGHNRPEFICVRVTKPTPNSSVGIFLRQKDGAVRITRTAPDGLLGKSVLQPGDRIVSVNGICCLRSTSKRVVDLIAQANDVLSLVVHDKEGDPSLVMTSILKPTRNALIGVWLKQYRGALKCSRIKPGGLFDFDGSLLSSGHRIMEINGTRCDTVRTEDAAKLIADSPDYVTVVSRPRDECAMVLSCDSHVRHWRNAAIACSVAAGVLSAANSFS
jgi:hypothetical protein